MNNDQSSSSEGEWSTDEEEEDDVEPKQLTVPQCKQVWHEKWHHKPDSLVFPSSVFSSMRFTPCGRFVLTSNYIIGLHLIDLVCGMVLKFKLENVPRIEASKDQLLNLWEFFMTSQDEGVLFWSKPSGEERMFNVYATRFKINYNEKSIHQQGTILQLTQLSYCHIEQLTAHETVSFYMSKSRALDNGEHRIDFSVQRFNLRELAFFDPLYTYWLVETDQNVDYRLKSVEMVLSTWFRNNFYSYENIMRPLDEMLRSFETILVVSANRTVSFDNSNTWRPFDPQDENLQNLISIDFNGTWRDHLLYLNVSLLLKFNDEYVYQPYMAMYDLETLTWFPINFNVGSSLSSRVPIRLGVTNDDSLVLVQSINLLNSYQVWPFPNGKLDSLNAFINHENGHAHCGAYRIALRRPDPLQLMCTWKVNSLYPKWKFLFNRDSAYAPLEIQKLNELKPNPVAFNLRDGVLKCPECKLTSKDHQRYESLGSYYQHSLPKVTHLFRENVLNFIITFAAFIVIYKGLELISDAFPSSFQKYQLSSDQCVTDSRDFICFLAQLVGVPTLEMALSCMSIGLITILASLKNWYFGSSIGTYDLLLVYVGLMFTGLVVIFVKAKAIQYLAGSSIRKSADEL